MPQWLGFSVVATVVYPSKSGGHQADRSHSRTPVEAGTQALPDHSTHGRFSTLSLRTTCYSPGVQSDSVMSDPEVM